ncbi:MAG: MmgE/PrpD family protein [Chloroflexi bacterium]|nr:MmgE/PrpD family protein [Chloroflexota bacterium]
MTISEEMAGALLAMRFEQIPSSAVSSAGKLLLDHFCVAVVGSSTPWGRAVLSLGRQTGGAAESLVYFTRTKLPSPAAAFINGTYAHGFELDDHRGLGAHPGAVVIPAAIAAGQRRGVDGRTLLTAIVSGYEVLARLSTAMRSIGQTGHHPTGSLGAFGSAVAAGIVLGLGRAPLVSAMGLAGNFATGVTEFYRGGMEKRLFAGRAAESGVLACLLADAGITAAPTIFEGEFGFCRSFGGKVDLSGMLDGLGHQFHIDQYFVKRYPCGGFAHPYVEAAVLLRRKNCVLLGDMENAAALVIEGRKLTPAHANLSVRDVLSAQYSIPYTVAVTLCYGPPTTEAFSDGAINDPVVTSLLERCQLVAREDYPGTGRVTVRLKDGTELTEEAVDPQKPALQIDKQEIIDKAVSLFAPFTGLEGARRLVEGLDNMVGNLEEARDIRQVMELMPVFAPAG